LLLLEEAFSGSECTKYHLAAGLCPDPLALDSLQRSPSWIKGSLLLRERIRDGSGGREGNGGQERRRERDGEWAPYFYGS